LANQSPRLAQIRQDQQITVRPRKVRAALRLRSTWRPPRCSASPWRNRCCSAPTRSSS